MCVHLHLVYKHTHKDTVIFEYLVHKLNSLGYHLLIYDIETQSPTAQLCFGED